MTDPAGLRDEPAQADVTVSDVAFHGSVWDVRSDTLRYGDDTFTRQYVYHPGAAAVVAVDAADRILVIQQYRHPIRMRDWELPAGLLDIDGEAPIDAARRELAEEADLVAGDVEPLIQIRTSPGGSNEVVHLFLARDLSPTSDAFERTQEEADIRREWIGIDDAVSAVLSGRFQNAILVAGILATAERARRG